MIRYYKLFDMLNRRGMKKTDLLEVISAPTLAKISKGKNINTDVIDKICLFLECQPSDIMEVVYDEIDTVNEDGTKVVFKLNDINPEDNEQFLDDIKSIRTIVEDPEKLKSYIDKIVQQKVEDIAKKED